MGLNAESGSEEKMVRDYVDLGDESEFVIWVENGVYHRVGDRGEPKMEFSWEDL